MMAKGGKTRRKTFLSSWEVSEQQKRKVLWKRAEKTISHLFVFQQLQNHKFLHCHEIKGIQLETVK